MSKVRPISTETTAAAKRYKAGVLRYVEMGYWQPDYKPLDTDLVVLFRITPQAVSPDHGPGGGR